MKTPPLISIVVNTKNEEKHLEKCLESCIEQDYKNIGIIVVDNNSTDRTKEIARKYTSQIFNKGPERSAQKNFGARKASGEYVLFLDADARLERTVLSECVALAQNRNYSMVIIPERHIGEGFWAEVKALERSFYLGDDTVEAPWFFRKKDFLSVGGYDEEMFAGEDWNLFDRMVQKGFTYGRCQSFINHQIGRLTALGMIKKKFYYGTNIKVFLKKGKSKSARRNPLLRPAIFRNAHYLLKSPIKYLAIFALKFFETMGILAGMISHLAGGKKEELSKLMVDIFYPAPFPSEKRCGVNLNHKDQIRFLKLCSGNRVLYQIVENLLKNYAEPVETRLTASLQDLQRIIKAAEKEIEKTQKTLDFVKENLPDSLLVKTYKFIPYITNDLDILVSSKKELEGFKKENHPGKQDKYQKNYFRDDMLRIDLHEDFYWQGFKFVDVERVFENTQIVEYFGRQVTIPSYTFEFLLNCAHILFEKRYVTLLDFYYLKKLLKEGKVDFGLVGEQTKKYGWSSALNLLLKEVKEIEDAMGKSFSFPVFLSARKIAKIYGEKCWFDRKLPLVDILYYAFARIRGKLGIKTRYPYYLHWFDFSRSEIQGAKRRPFDKL